MCIRAVWVKKEHPVLVGRTLDWSKGCFSDIRTMPRGKRRDGGVGKNALEWISKYGNVVISGCDGTLVEGMNEKGLMTHLFCSPGEKFPDRDTAMPGLSTRIWGQFYLDCFARVSVAVDATVHRLFQLQAVRSSPGEHPFPAGSTAVFLADAYGDFAEIVLMDGQVTIRHGRHDPLRTALLDGDVWEGLNGLGKRDGKKNAGLQQGDCKEVFTGMTDPMVSLFPESGTRRSAMQGVLDLMQTAMFSGNKRFHGVHPCGHLWCSVGDATHLGYYFKHIDYPEVVWVHLDDLALAQGAPVMRVSLSEAAVPGGDLSARFEPV